MGSNMLNCPAVITNNTLVGIDLRVPDEIIIFMSEDLCDCVIRSEVYGSDHCPLVLAVALD